MGGRYGLVVYLKYKNRKYYEYHANHDAKAESKVGSQEEEPKYHPFTTSMTFPNLLGMGTALFISGLTESASDLYFDDDAACGMSCKWPALVVLCLTALWMCLSAAQLLWFYSKFASDTWESEEPLDDPKDVEDPLFQLVSWFRVRFFCPTGRGYNVFDRARGSFERPEDELEEPARTERILAHPWRLFHDHAADSIDTLSMLWLNRASLSNGILGVGYEYFTLLAQIAVVMISSSGGGGPAIQMTSILSIQWGMSLYVFSMGPSSDRFDNLMSGLSWTLEGLGTFTLLMQLYLDEDRHEVLSTAAFYSAIFSMFLPIIEKGYDGVFYPIYKCCAKTDAGSPTEIAMAFCAFLLTIPALVASMAGFGVDGFESATDGLVNLAEASAAMDVAGVGADLLSNVVWSDRQHNAARNIQRRFKNKLATKQAPTMDPFVLAMKRASKVDPKRMPQTSALDQPKLKVKVRRLKHSESRSMEGQVALGCKPNSVTTETACAKPGPGSGHTDEPNGAGQSRQNIVSQVNAIACTDDGSAGQQGLEPVWTSPSQRSAECVAPSNLTASALATPAAMSMDNLVQTEMEAQLAGLPDDLPVDLAWLAVSSFLESGAESRSGSEALARARAAKQRRLSRTDSTWV
uniref:Uncharacterized protein n=1 Tax=Haptolina brevifila TaxID=156173 RepID=A0A7S2C200_9EUKA